MRWTLRATPDQLCDALGACADLNPVYGRLQRMRTARSVFWGRVGTSPPFRRRPLGPSAPDLALGFAVTPSIHTPRPLRSKSKSGASSGRVAVYGPECPTEKSTSSQ